MSVVNLKTLARRTVAQLLTWQPLVEAHITVERIRRYITSISEVAPPSTTASALRGPVLRELLRETKALPELRLHFDLNYENTGNSVILTGPRNGRKKLWYFAHLDTISYLVQPKEQSRYPLVPFGYHMIQNGNRPALAYRFVSFHSRYEIVARGRLESEDGRPFFRPESGDPSLKPGDRIVFSTSYEEDPSGNFSAHVDNAGAVAALLAAAPVLAAAKVDALLVFPDEEEGPPGSGNQLIGRGSARMLNLFPVPELVIVSDVQQAGAKIHPNQSDRGGEGPKLGGGAVLSEFSSLARGAVTPPHLYVLAVELVAALQEVGVKVQLSNNSYTSRSDDVSAMLKTPNVLLLGFPGFNRHFDLGEPMANIHDLVDLAKAMVYFAALRKQLRQIWKQFERETE
jgi:putative aminopeptidase FrvX